MNTFRTVFLMTLMMVLLLFVGELLGGSSGMMIAFLISLVMNFGSYWFSDKIVLMMYHAKQVNESEFPKLYSTVRRLSQFAQLPMPKVYVMENPAPNAFATGRNPEHAAVAVTTGILNILSEDELSGVLAHELAHVKHRDILLGTITATLVGTITYVAHMAQWAAIFGGGRDRDNGSGLGDLALIIVAPIAAMLIQLSISRSREFAADAGGAAISGQPLSLASALNKLSKVNERLPMKNAEPATAHMFIVSPFSRKSLFRIFSTHPPIEERIKRLQEIASGSM
ncbi:MAG: zinc metalloprotease HtpX [Ignavibacteriales bacterium]|nr:zinc metalloprotease HtpX [Ignavibacteriales bacterium]